MKRVLAVLVMLTVVVSGCGPHVGSKERAGTVAGAGAGALVGAHAGRGHGPGQLIAVVVGALAGAIVGSEIGRALDEADRRAMRENAQYALENNRTGEASTWRNPDTGHYGSFRPVETYRRDSGQYCREYTQRVVIGGEPQQAYGTACRQPDGSWKIVD